MSFTSYNYVIMHSTYRTLVATEGSLVATSQMQSQSLNLVSNWRQLNGIKNLDSFGA